MKKYLLSFASSGVVIGEATGKEELFSLLNSNKCIYEEKAFDAEEGDLELEVENPDNLDYIDNIDVSWKK